MHEFTTASTTVADIVAHDLRAASVFARYGIDFCCGGRRSIAEACRANGTDGDAVLRELEVLSASQSIDTTGWSLTRLIDHIESKHHAYVRRQIPALEALTGKLAAVHGGQHPDMVSIASVFGALAAELERHMAKEEQLLFPHIRSLVAAHDAGTPFPPNPFGSVRNPIRMMEIEHSNAGEDMRSIHRLTHNYTPPGHACTTWRACYAELAAFERDLHQHVHLENNVLFPAAARLEEERL